MMKRFLAAAGMALILALPLHPLTIKIGSIAPIGSPWDEALKALAAEWHEISDGNIELKAYMGGIAGDETDLVRKIRLGQLQAAAITELGLNRVTREVLALNVPFLMRDDEEFDYVLSEMTPYFDSLAEARGFIVLAWIKAGWVHFFAKEPVIYPGDLRKQPLAVPDGDPEILHAWQDLGFRSLPLSIPDYLLGLQSGMISALYAPPLVAAVYQWFGIANHMCSLAITPVVAAIVVDSRVWSRLDPDLRPRLLNAVDRIRRNLEEETEELTVEGVSVMQDYGLIVHPVPDDAAAEWRAMVQKGFELVVGESFSRETYERIVGLIQKYRNR